MNQDKMKTNLNTEKGGPLVFGHSMDATRLMLTWDEYFVNCATEQTEEASEGGMLSDNNHFLLTRFAGEKIQLQYQVQLVEGGQDLTVHIHKHITVFKFQ